MLQSEELNDVCMQIIAFSGQARAEIMVAVAATLGIGLQQSLGVTRNIIDVQVQDKLTGADKLLQTYLGDRLGPLTLASDGVLQGGGKSLDGKEALIDEFATDMLKTNPTETPDQPTIEVIIPQSCNTPTMGKSTFAYGINPGIFLP